jgi:hypothetical protein
MEARFFEIESGSPVPAQTAGKAREAVILIYSTGASRKRRVKGNGGCV